MFEFNKYRPKALMNKYSTIRKVLRAALVLGKSLWQQSRVEDAFQLMQRAAVRAIEVMPCKSDRNTQEDHVLLELFRIAKRAKLVGKFVGGGAAVTICAFEQIWCTDGILSFYLSCCWVFFRST